MVQKTRGEVTVEADAVTLNAVEDAVKVMDAEAATVINWQALFITTAVVTDILPDNLNVLAGVTMTRPITMRMNSLGLTTKGCVICLRESNYVNIR